MKLNRLFTSVLALALVLLTATSAMAEVPSPQTNVIAGVVTEGLADEETLAEMAIIQKAELIDENKSAAIAGKALASVAKVLGKEADSMEFTQIIAARITFKKYTAGVHKVFINVPADQNGKTVTVIRRLAGTNQFEYFTCVVENGMIQLDVDADLALSSDFIIGTLKENGTETSLPDEIVNLAEKKQPAA